MHFNNRYTYHRLGICPSFDEAIGAGRVWLKCWLLLVRVVDVGGYSGVVAPAAERRCIVVLLPPGHVEQLRELNAAS